MLTERNTEHHAGSAFMAKCRHELERLARDFEIPLGQFLLSQTSPIGLEKRGARLTADEARAIVPETQDELIRVFVPGEREPKAIVDVEHSLLSLCSDHDLQMFRLYVIYEKTDKESVVAALRERVREW